MWYHLPIIMKGADKMFFNDNTAAYFCKMSHSQSASCHEPANMEDRMDVACATSFFVSLIVGLDIDIGLRLARTC